MSEEIILEARNISKTFPGRQGGDDLKVLDGIDISIPQNKAVSIVGASGSGKSTLLHILGGLDKPTDGTVHYKGTDLTSLSADKLAEFRNRNLGFVFQFHHLLPEFTALENVFMPGLISRRPLDELKGAAADKLGQLGLGNRLHHRPSELSGGEQQRVAVARALMNNPDIIMADEPTGNLDEKSTRTLLDVLFPLVESHKISLVLVTHDMGIAGSCDKTYRLEHGKLAV
jgi:lipoprotein-releasing system ATP-binding protein